MNGDVIVSGRAARWGAAINQLLGLIPGPGPPRGGM